MKRAVIRPAVVALAAVLAAGIAGAETFRIYPSISIAETYSDNVALLPDEQSGWATELTPGIRAELTGARVKGVLDFRLANSYYSIDSRFNRTQRFLNSTARVEAIESLLFVEAQANVNQQNRSPFGTAVNPVASTASSNRVETRSYQVVPSIRGELSNVASYQLRVSEAEVRSNEAELPATRSTEWVAKIGSASRSAKLGWSVDANALRVRNDAVGKLEDARIRGSLIYAFNPQIRVSLIEGHEATDFAGPPRRRNDTPGVGLLWSPSERTQLSGVYERRFFGDGHFAAFTHRTPLTTWRLYSSRDTAVLPVQLANSSLNSIEGLMSQLLASTIPDPDDRAVSIRRRLEESGISGSSALNSNVLTSRPFVSTSSGASVALLGATTTLTLTLSRREQRPFLVDLGGETGSLVDEAFRQSGFDVNLSRKITPLTSLTLSVVRLRTESLTISSRHANQDSYGLSLTTRLGPRTLASLAFRHVDFESSTVIDNYRENAIFGSLSFSM